MAALWGLIWSGVAVRVLLEVAWVLDHAGWWLVQLVLIGLIEVNIWDRTGSGIH